MAAVASVRRNIPSSHQSAPESETGTRALRHLFGPVAIVTIVVFALLLIVRFDWGLPEPEAKHEQPVNVALTPESRSDLAALLEYQLEAYRADLAHLDTNISLQALLIAMTILLVIRRLHSLSLLGNSFPVSWLHIIVPLLFAYLWLQFGFTMNDLIWGRIRGVQTIEAAHRSTVRYEKAIFSDAGFVNGWFVSFIDEPDKPGKPGHDFSGSGQTPEGASPGFLVTGATAIFLVLLLGTLVSATNASMLALLPIFCRRYLRGPYALRWYYVSTLLPLAILVLSQVQFAYAGNHRTWAQLYVPALTIPFMMFFLWMSAVADRKTDPDAIQLLRRQHHAAFAGGSRRHRWQLTHSADAGRLRTMSLIGDSVSSSFHLGSLPRMLFRRWIAWKRNWFINLYPDEAMCVSVVERTSGLGPILGTNHASVSAMVDEGGRRTLMDRVTDTLHFSHQVDEVLIGTFPDILLIWIGHNNLDWRVRTTLATEQSLGELAHDFRREYETQIRRLIRGAVAGGKPAVIVAFGLMNIESFSKARAEAERRRLLDRRSYMYLELGYQYFQSLKPEYRSEMCELAKQCNEQINLLCQDLRMELSDTKVRLVYSDALATAQIDRADLLASDAWHPSPFGHRLIADLAYRTVREQTELLGWT